MLKNLVTGYFGYLSSLTLWTMMLKVSSRGGSLCRLRPVIGHEFEEPDRI
jgi:hypothetical protein